MPIETSYQNLSAQAANTVENYFHRAIRQLSIAIGSRWS